MELSLSFTTNYNSYSSTVLGSVIIAIPTDMIVFTNTASIVVKTGAGATLTPSSITSNSTYYEMKIPNWCTADGAGLCAP